MIHHCNSGCSHGNHHHPSQTYSSPAPAKPKAPDGSNFQITDVKEYGFHQVLLVKYPGVSTFKGMKCLVVRASMADLVKVKTLDPHFYDGKRLDNIKVVARFPPDTEGVENAKKFALAIGGGNFKDREYDRGGPGDR